jgi:hypothetical protein
MRVGEATRITPKFSFSPPQRAGMPKAYGLKKALPSNIIALDKPMVKS